MKRKNTHSIFYKYLVSFLVAALIPLGIAIGSFYLYNVQSLREQTEKINLQKLKAAAGLVDEAVSGHFRIVSSLAVDPSLRPRQLTGSVYERYQCLNTMKPLLSRYPELEKGFFILKEEDCVYSASGIMSYDTFRNMELDIRAHLSGEQEYLVPYLLFPAKEEGRLVFTYPVPTYTPYGHLVFLMETDTVKQTIASAFPNQGLQLFLASPDRTVLYDEFTREPPGFDKARLLDLSASPGSLAGMDLDKKNGQRESLLYYTSGTTGITYAVAVSVSLMAEGDGGFQENLLVLLCFLILFLCLTLAVAVSFFNYRPIRDLFRLMDKSGGRRNELQALHEYIEDQKKIEDTVSWQEPYLKQRIMELFLDGMIEEKELERAFTDFCFPGEGNCYTAVAIRLFREKGTIHSLYRQEILNFSLELEIRSALHICCIEKPRDSSICWIVNGAQEREFSELAMEIDKGLAPILADSPDIRYVFGIGSRVKELRQTKDSFYEALAAAEYLKQNQSGRMLFYENLGDSLRQAKSPDGEELLKLIQALRHGDYSLSDKIFGRYFENLVRKYQSVLLFKYFVLDMVKSLKDALADYIPAQLQEEFSSLVTVEGADILKTRMEELLGRVCTYTAQSRKSRQEDLTERILRYVQEHAFSPELSLERLGDEFGLSPYYISRFITEQTGENMKSYITQLRLEETKRLLEGTELPIQEIVSHIGYLDTSSFIRKFKRETGETPGEYRENRRRPKGSGG